MSTNFFIPTGVQATLSGITGTRTVFLGGPISSFKDLYRKPSSSPLHTLGRQLQLTLLERRVRDGGFPKSWPLSRQPTGVGKQDLDSCYPLAAGSGDAGDLRRKRGSAGFAGNVHVGFRYNSRASERV